MKVIIKPFCALEKFSINGIRADQDDFGERHKACVTNYP